MDINDYIDSRNIDEIEKEFYIKFLYYNHQDNDCLTLSHNSFGMTTKQLDKIEKIKNLINPYQVFDFIEPESEKSSLIFLTKTINNAKINNELIVFYNKKIYFINDKNLINNIKKYVK